MRGQTGSACCGAGNWEYPSLLAPSPPYHQTQLLPKFDRTNGHTRIGPQRGLRRRERFA